MLCSKIGSQCPHPVSRDDNFVFVMMPFKEEYEKAITDYSKSIELNPDDIIPYQGLAELYIITGKYEEALHIIDSSLYLSLELKDQAIILYLECIAGKMLGRDVSENEKIFYQILEKDFETTWSFDIFVSWLATSAVDKDKKAFIFEKTKLLKKHKK